MTHGGLDPERWKEVERTFHEALRLSADKREAYVRQVCGEDTEVREAVLAMLAAGEPGPEFLDPPRWSEPELPRTLGDFELLSVLGSGGMGTVFRARQLSLDRTVALKILAPHAIDPRRIERFRREALAIGRLRHEGIVTVYGVGETEGSHWIAMECVDGHDFAKEIARQGDPDSDEPILLPPFESKEYFAAVAELCAQVAAALRHAHGRGIVHRDLKPQNLLLSDDRRARLVDFGLARDERLGTLSATGDLMGTPYYMSPEQARAVRQEVDHRTDIYSLGVVLYEALTLTRPFEGGTSLEVLRQIRRREPRAIRNVNPRVPHDLAVVAMKAMAKSVRDRYADAGELEADLRHFLNHEAVTARPLALPVRWMRAVERRPVPSAVGAATIVLVAVAFLLGGRIVRAARIGSLSDTLRAEFAVHGEAVRSLPSGELRRMRLLLDELELELEVSSDLVRGLRAELERYRSDGLAEAEGFMESVGEGTTLSSADLWQRTRAASILRDASHVFPEDGELADLLARASPAPTLSVRAAGAATGVSGEVLLRRIDLFTGTPGPAKPLGALPVEAFPVEPGYYRVVARLGDGAATEYTRYVSASSSDNEVVVRPCATPPSTAGMVFFDRVTFTVPDEGNLWCNVAGTAVELEPFWIDEAEVTNGEYAAFLARNPDVAPPPLWVAGTDAPGWDSLPVTAVTWLDARAYAECVGKRLPTHLEWEYAARGAEGRRYPWPETATPPAANVNAAWVQPTDWSHAHEIYLRDALPVRSLPEARTPEGLFHMYGNVREITESVAVVTQFEEVLPRLFDRWVVGGSWRAIAWRQTLEHHDYTGTGPDYENFDQGFRCARSEDP